MKHSVQMMAHLRRAATEMGRAIVIVVHDIDYAGHYADHMCAVKQGSVVEFGPPEGTITAEVLSRVFGTPAEAIDGPAAGWPSNADQTGAVAGRHLCRMFGRENRCGNRMTCWRRDTAHRSCRKLLA